MIDTQAIRNKILDLAMRGQLTKQLPEDGTAEELFQKIQANRLKSDKSKPIQNINNEDISFDIPSNWMWIRLGGLVDILGGKRIPAGRKLTTENTGHKYIRVSDMKEMSVDTSNLMYVPDDIYPSISRYIIKKEDVYITVAGTIGRVGTIPDELDGANLTENADRLVFSLLDKKWLVFCLASSVVQKQIDLLTTQVAQPKLAIKRIQEFCIPLPPLAEQQRIVEKVDQAFSVLNVIDTLQTQYTDNLTTLKAKLIDAAIQGKLTEQLPEDGTAEELYQQIQEEKQALIKEGKIKKRKSQPEIYNNEFSFDIPSNWKWVPLGELISIESGRGLTAVEMNPGRIPVYGGNGITGYHDSGFVPEGTVVIGRVGYYCGSVHVTEQEAWVTDNAFITTYPEKSIDKWFLVYALRHMKLGQNNNGSAQPVVSGKKIYPLAFPLPPLAEQKRIVARLEEILPMCEG